MAWLTPVEIAIKALGSRGAVAVAVGRTGAAITHWRDGSRRRRPGDIPEVSYIRTILARPEAKGLTAEHLTHGASAAEIDAILASRPPAVERVDGPGGPVGPPAGVPLPEEAA